MLLLPKSPQNDACIEGLLLKLIASSTAVAISTAPRAIKGKVTNIKSEICQDLVNPDNIFMPSMEWTCQMKESGSKWIHISPPEVFDHGKVSQK